MRRLPWSRVAIVLVALITLIGSSRQASAIDGVVFDAGTGHWYKYYADNVTWTEAKARATTAGGYLTVLTTQAENDWVQNNVLVSSAWIGATDEVTEGTYAWVTGETWSYTDWNAGEPNNANGGSGGEDYVEFSGNGWNDEPNTDTQGNNGYIVEWDKNPNITDPPEDPENLVGTATGDRQISLTWDDVSDIEDAHEVERAIGAGAFTQIANLGVDVEAYTDTTVDPETEYSYRVRANNVIGPSGYSNTVTVTTPAHAPSGLVLTAISNTVVQVDWVDESDAETGYEIERAIGCPGTTFVRVAILAEDVTTYQDDTVLPETVYTYRVRSLSVAGNSGYDSEECVRTPPVDPGNVAPGLITNGGVTLSWIDGSDTETGYEVERSIGCPGTAFGLIATLPPDSTAYTDNAAAPETEYSYRVRAISNDGASDWSPEICITTPPRAPSGVAADAGSSTRVEITWNDLSAVETGFEITRALVRDGIYEPLTSLPADTTNYVDRTVSQESDYSYRVAAIDENGRSAWTVAPDTSTPAALIITSVKIKRAKAGSKKPSKMTLAGEFDIGFAGPDLTGAATLFIGETRVRIDGFAPKGKGLRFQSDTERFDLKPSTKGGSRVPFKLTSSGAAVDALDPNGELTMTFESGSFSAGGVIELERDQFKPGKIGRLVDPPLFVSAMSGSLKTGSGDTLKLKAVFDASTGTPADAQTVLIRIGFFEFEALAEKFTQKKDQYRFLEKIVAARKITVDHKKGTVSVVLKGVELGGYEKGALPIEVSIQVGDVSFGDAPVVPSTGSKLKY